MLKQTAILLFSMVMMVSYSQSTPKQPVSDNTEVATFAGGCFWCTESDFEKVPGVIKAISGYIGGDVENPTYQDVSNGITGHAEAVEVYFNPNQVSYRQLLDVYWKTINPTDMGGQFVDRGSQYRPVIFYHNQDQKLAAEQSRLALEESAHFDKPIVTGIQKASRFWPAEEYHQDYHQKNPIRYKYYRYSSGRDQFLDATWGKNALKAEIKKIMNQSDSHTVSKQVLYQKPSDEELRERLSPLQFQVTQRDATERPFDNAYWDEKREGIYVDIASGEPLFSSKDKFKSGTGWPSFTQPLYSENIVEKSDFSLFSRRTEVRSKNGDSHLGHLFEDGPKPTGLRYCINSASLRFIPKDLLNQEGYEDLTALF